MSGGITGEATPYYMFHPLAPTRIAADLPHVKLIAILRNPVDRAYSQFNHMVRVGREPLSFDEALDQEQRLSGEVERIKADPAYSTFKHLHYSYQARGRYAEQIENWLGLFSRSQMLFLSSEELYTSPASLYTKAIEFLGLAKWEPQGFKAFKQGVYENIPADFFPHLDEAHTREMLRERAPWFEKGAMDIGWSIEVRFEHRLAESFGRGRVWLAGDAAHLTGPAGMQSMNAGLAEAHDLAARMKRIREGQAGLDLLDAYGRERLADWAFLLGRRGGLRPGAATPEFVARSAARLLSCLPATGSDLPPLAAQLGFEVDRG